MDIYSTSISFSKDSEDSGENASSAGMEISGYLSKKSSKGLYNHRFFATDGKYLFYWTDKTQFDTGAPHSERYDICEIMHIDKAPNRGFTLFFMNNKFKLELRAMSDEQLSEWVEFLQAKKSLYSVDELLVDLTKDRISFKTKTFQSLMVLREKDQNRFINDRIDEYFKIAVDETQTKRNQRKPKSHTIIQSARRAVLDFKTTCKECFDEMDCRNPKVIAHCRNYIRKYAEILKGRVTLELLCIPGTQEKQFEGIGEKAICAAIELMNEIDDLREFSFLPTTLIESLNTTLFSAGQLLSALLNISLQRVDAFFASMALLFNNQRPAKLLDIVKVVSETLQAVEVDKQYPQLLRTLLLKLVTSQLLSFSDQLTMLSFEDYDEATIVSHINFCEQVKQLFLTSYISVSSQSIVATFDAAQHPETSTSSESGDRIPMPAAILDAVNSACEVSGKYAALRAVQNMRSSAADLLSQGVLQERMSSWISGGFCSALIDRLHSWVEGFTGSLHHRYKEVLFVETCRLMILVYVSNIINCYKSNKQIKVSTEGIEHIISDLQTIHSWAIEHIPPSMIQVEAAFLLMLIQFLFSTHENLINCFSDSVQMFGLQYSLHVYDILRLMLKYRMDLSSTTRRSVLGLCGEFLNQLQVAVAADPSLLSGEVTAVVRRADLSILERLCPQAGVEHCTGKKWKVEILSDPVPVRLTVALLVNQTCNAARDRRRDMQTKSLHATKALSPKEALRESLSEQKSTDGSASAAEKDRRRSVSAPRPGVDAHPEKETSVQKTKPGQFSPPVPGRRRSVSAARKPPRQLPQRSSAVKKVVSCARVSKSSGSGRQNVINLLDRALQSSDTIIESLSNHLHAIRSTDGGDVKEPTDSKGESDSTAQPAPNTIRNDFTEVDSNHSSKTPPVIVAPAVEVPKNSKPLPPPKPKKPSSFIAVASSKDSSSSMTKKYANPFDEDQA